MIELSLIPTIYDNLDNIDKIKGQLIYCADTGNVAYDIDDLLRIDIGCARLLDSEDEREKLTDPKINTLYIVKLSNTCWRYDSTIGWAEITYYEAIQDIYRVFILGSVNFSLSSSESNNLAHPISILNKSSIS